MRQKFLSQNFKKISLSWKSTKERNIIDRFLRNDGRSEKFRIFMNKYFWSQLVNVPVVRLRYISRGKEPRELQDQKV